MTTLSVENLVVDSSSIEVSRRARQAKADRLDGEKLLRMLLRYWSGERDVWHVVHVPTRAGEDARHASRALTTLPADRTRLRNQIIALWARRGTDRAGERAAEGVGRSHDTLRRSSGRVAQRPELQKRRVVRVHRGA
jgi:hypothetical protein